MADDGGVLGNLPTPVRAGAARSGPATPRAAAEQRTPADRQGAPAEPQADPVGEVIRAASGLASAGARVANGVAREVSAAPAPALGTPRGSIVTGSCSGVKDSPRCLIVDDHPVVRAGVRAVLEQAFGESSVSDAASLEEASSALNGEAPDVVIVDPWRVGVDVGDVVGKLRGELRRRSSCSPPTAARAC